MGQGVLSVADPAECKLILYDPAESYTNMNAMEFISDEYASWDVTYFMNGLILNRLPLRRS